MIGEIGNHLWQSSLFVVAAALVAIALRKNRAHIRYWVWLAASLKFFGAVLLVDRDRQLFRFDTGREEYPFGIAFVYRGAIRAAVLKHTAVAGDARPSGTDKLAADIVSRCMACGVWVVVSMRIREWLRIRAILEESVPSEIPFPIQVRISAELMEPGVVGLNLFGLSKAVLLLPEGLTENLTAQQLEAVLAHELFHVRRSDNLTAVMHMLAETIFWFHPFVW